MKTSKRDMIKITAAAEFLRELVTSGLRLQPADVGSVTREGSGDVTVEVSEEGLRRSIARSLLEPRGRNLVTVEVSDELLSSVARAGLPIADLAPMLVVTSILDDPFQVCRRSPRETAEAAQVINGILSKDSSDAEKVRAYGASLLKRVCSARWVTPACVQAILALFSSITLPSVPTSAPPSESDGKSDVARKS